MSAETLAYDEKLRLTHPIIVGCDEVGRGCLAGPVVTAAVILPAGIDIPGVMDSKKIKKSEHEKLARLVYETAIEVQIGIKDADVIDDVNILEADKLAMLDTINNLRTKPDLILIDGDSKQYLNTAYDEQVVIKGDATSLTIGAASILAKYIRDRIMANYDKKYPGYGFAKNAGYGTAQHRAALAKLGVTPIHRKTFEPIKSQGHLWKTNNGI